MGSLPTRFWVTTGVGIHPEHQINAYDQALYMAGISEQNIMGVSSVPPPVMIKPKIINGISYVPVPDSDAITKFTTTRLYGEKGAFFTLENSWCIDVVLARSDGDQGERVTSSIGLGWYKPNTPKETHGVYAVEDHGNKDYRLSLDNCQEMLDRMMTFRKVNPIQSPHLPHHGKGEIISEEKIPLCDVTTNNHLQHCSARRIIWESASPLRQIHAITIDSIPEGYVGTAIAVVVFDPFTEIHS
jgi:pyruvoyl-dependent arginine decarboxylase (PvlArgDC)